MMKYSDEVVNNICESIKIGHTQKDAAMLAGLSETTFYRWLSKKEEENPLSKKERREFRESLKRSHKPYKDNLLKVLHGAVTAKKDARTTLEILARRFPAEWGEKLKLEVAIDPQKEIKKMDERIKGRWQNQEDSTKS